MKDMNISPFRKQKGIVKFHENGKETSKSISEWNLEFKKKVFNIEK